MHLGARFRARGMPEGIRHALCRATWGTDDVPNLQPTSVEKYYTGTSFRSSYPSLSPRVDLLVCPLPRGGFANVHLVFPVTPLNRVVVLHAGHSDHYYNDSAQTGMELISVALVTAGYHVVGVCMPVGGFNPNPLVLDRAGGGTMSFTDHTFADAEADGVVPLRLFVDPTIAAIRYVVDELRPLSIDMTGLSGGGWTTDWVAALCRLVRRSVPVFGSLPFSLRPPGDVGDWEQSSARSFWDPLRGEALGLEESLYALGGTGAVARQTPGEATGRLELGGPRRRLQILGPLEPVFPIATVQAQVAAYNAAVQRVVGAECADVWQDTAATLHAYTAESTAQVMATLGA